MESLSNKFPPVAASYQSTEKPFSLYAARVGIVSPSQYALSPPLIGCGITGQTHSGAATTTSVEQPFKTDVIVTTLVSANMPVISFPLTVPAVAVTVPLEINVTLYVVKSAEQLTFDIIKYGGFFTVISISEIAFVTQGAVAAT